MTESVAASANAPETVAGTQAANAANADDWRRNAVVYQIYPRSFADGNGDGIGDLPGVLQHLDDLADLGIDAVWLSPFYPSPQADAGYDVADYRDVEPLFGTLSDFDELVRRTHELGMRLIIDLVPNHSSDAHVWFQAALAAPAGSGERARYIFRDGKGTAGELPPNNWLSIFGGPAWTRTTDPDGSPGQWYLHMFDTRQPDWNWDNPEVAEEFRSVLRFWLDRGVDGFRIDVANALIKAENLPDITDGWTHSIEELPDGFSEPEPTTAPMFDREGVHEVYRDWRKVLDAYSPPRMLVAEAWVRPLSRLARYVRRDEMDQAFNFDFLNAPWTAPVIRGVINQSMTANATVGAPTTWVLSNHDVLRHTSRFGLPQDQPRPNGIRAGDRQPDAELGLRRARAATLLMLALPGSAYLYQGEELGLPEATDLPDDLRQDPIWWRTDHTVAGRDGCRVPLPWTAADPALGFSPTGASWLPQPAAFRELARDRQRGVAGSTLELYRAALRLRREYGLAAGDVDWQDAADGVLAFTSAGLTVVANLSKEAVPLPSGEVLISSTALDGDGRLPIDATVWLR